jgi:type IV secretory pathway TraG/TraD family ATPase VirD4
VEKGDEGSWLFITVKADQLPSLRPLITVWLDIAISAIMSLKPDHGRRLYCVVDELPTLQKLPSLSDFLARARKYGGCGILGFSPSATHRHLWQGRCRRHHRLLFDLGGAEGE